MINKRLSELSCNQERFNKAKPLREEAPSENNCKAHHYSLKSLNVTPIEIDCVKWYSLIPHSARRLKPTLGKPFKVSQTTLSKTPQIEYNIW